jgi:hypothetical protein
VAENPLQQQLDLDSLEIGLEVLAVRLAGDGRDGRHGRCYRYSHTRNSDSSCSVSTGFVM